MCWTPRKRCFCSLGRGTWRRKDSIRARQTEYRVRRWGGGVINPSVCNKRWRSGSLFSQYGCHCLLTEGRPAPQTCPPRSGSLATTNTPPASEHSPRHQMNAGSEIGIRCSFVLKMQSKVGSSSSAAKSFKTNSQHGDFLPRLILNSLSATMGRTEVSESQPLCRSRG